MGRAQKDRLPHYFPFVFLLFRTGMREGEAVALRPGDVDVRSRLILVERNLASGRFLEDRPKNGRRRQVDIAADLLTVLKDHLALRCTESALFGREGPEWLFTTPEGYQIRSNNFRDRIWNPLLASLGLRYRCVHAIRHTYATRLIMAGAPLVYVQRQLGHSSIQVTVDTGMPGGHGNARGSGTICAQRPSGRSDKWFLTPCHPRRRTTQTVD
ncbi:MAG: site-specific integrase [Nitrospirae bacterium]|nr:site-specific integrase [Nitrospirota bacterium]